MKCIQCGFVNEPGNCFCVRCGAQIPAFEPGESAAPPAWEEPYAPPRVSVRKKKNIPALLMGILNVLLAAVIVLMATGIADTVFAPNQGSFADPEDAINYFISHVKDNDFDGALSACAIKEAASNYDYQGMIDIYKYVMPNSQLLPSEYGMYEYSNEAYLKNNIMKQLSYMALSVVLPEEYAGVIEGYAAGGTDLDLSNLAESMNPGKFSDIEIVQIGEPETDMDQSWLENLAQSNGADEATMRDVLYKAGGSYYAGGFTLLRYGENWKIISLTDPTIRQPFTGALMPIGGKSDFRDMLKGDYTPTETPTPTATVAPSEAPSATAVSGGVINLYSFTSEVPDMLSKYKEMHPEFPWELNVTIVSTTDGLYEPALDEALAAGAVDIYCIESAFVTKYTQGDMSSYAMPYEELGINVDAEITAADIAPYIVDIGTRQADNAVIGLGYQSTGGALIYRRSIAKDVWGTDDPAIIKTKVGPGWDKFFEAAAELESHGFAIVSGDGDIWHSVENSADKGWIVDGKLYIDPKREAFLDYSKQLTNKRYSNGTQEWTEAWYSDISGTGEKPVFGFFGPSWLINYVMPGNSGGSAPGEGTYGDWAICEPPVGFFWGGTWLLANKELSDDPAKKAAVAELLDWITLQCGQDSFQYAWANGTTYGSGTKDTVASGTVMAMSDGALDFLGGQNMFDVFRPASRMANGGNITQYDAIINTLWRDQVRQYANGNKTRAQALADFKQAVKDQLGIDSL